MEEKKEKIEASGAKPDTTQQGGASATPAPKKKSFARRFVKGLLWTVFGLLLFIVFALLALPLWVNPVVTSVAGAVVPWCTGTEFKLEQFKLNPYTGKLTVSGLRLANPEGFAEKNAAALSLLDVDMDVASLLSKTIHVREVVIDSPFASYVFDAAGSNNFDRIIAEVERKLKLKKDKKEKEPSDVKVVVDKVTVRNVRAVVNTGTFELASLTLADFGKDVPAKLEIAGVKLVNPKGFPEPDAFSLKALNIGMDTADLKKSPMVFHDIIVDSTYAGLVYNDDGVSNIDAMFKPFMGDGKDKKDKDAKDGTEVAKAEKDKKDDTPRVTIDKLDIKGTKVQYRKLALPIPLPTFTNIGKSSKEGATMKEVGEQVFAKAQEGLSGVGGLVGMLGADATNLLGNATGFLGASATNLLGNATSIVSGGVSNVLSGATGVIGGGVSNVVSGTTGALKSATGVIGGGVSNVVSGTTGVLKGAAGGVVSGGVSNVVNGASSVIGGAKNLSEKAAEGAKDALKKLSPGNLFGN